MFRSEIGPNMLTFCFLQTTHLKITLFYGSDENISSILIKTNNNPSVDHFVSTLWMDSTRF